MAWLGGGAMAMGIGIWSMHYIGMEAFRLPVPVRYDWPTVLLSLQAAIVASLIALFVASRAEMGMTQALVGSVFMGGAIAAMHYIGMEAMRLPAMCHYSAGIVAFSVILAMVISLVALRLTFRLRGEQNSSGWPKAVSAVVMGAAIPTMHYTGMAAVRFTATAQVNGDLSHSIPSSSVGLVGVILTTFLILGLTLLSSLVDRRFSAQDQLRKSDEERFRIILESSHDGFVGMNAGGQITDWNAQAERVLGWAREEIQGQVFSEALLRPPHREAYKEEIRGLIVSNDTAVMSKRFETILTGRDGKEIAAEITISAMRHRGTHDFAAFVRDLRERKLAEGRFRGLLESAPDPMLIVDERGLIVLVNTQAEKLFGYSRAELLDQPMEILLPKRFQGRHVKQRAEFVGAPRIRPMGMGTELYAVRKDGTEFPVEVGLSPLETDEGLLVSTSIRDITERKEHEATLRAAKEAAEAASEAKSTFLATMSHEIRTPLNGVLGMTELVLDSELTAEQRENLRLVRISAESLLSIINDILDFSKIEAGKLELELIPFDLRESLGETMKSLSVRASQKGLELIYDVDPEVPETVIGDPGRIRQVLINVIANAVKFTERGEVFVRVQQQYRQGNFTRLHFSVKDTGIGIPAGKQETIFEAFSQADGSMTRKYGGTGLGLTICKKLVRLMGGGMTVESQPGQGSTFHFTLLLEVQERPSSRPAPLPPEQLQGLHTLIVDDNFTNRTVLSGMVSRWGMKPTAVESGHAALEAIAASREKGTPFDVILLDGQMPEMDGFMLAGHILKDAGVEKATVMMLTSAGHMGDAARCRELGVSGYLLKPVRQKELLEALCKALNPQTQKERPLITRHTLREERNRARVLVVEDNAINRALAIRILEKRGYSVEVANNGRLALDAVEKEDFDIVLMDVQMPEMNGFEATAAIRERERAMGKRTPIVAMTAHAFKEDIDLCLSSGMDAYISKPIQTRNLFETIEMLLEKKVELAELK